MAVNETMDGDFVFAKSETPKEVIDLSQAKPGDVFLTRDGEEVTYLGKLQIEDASCTFSSYPFAFEVRGKNDPITVNSVGSHMGSMNKDPFDVVAMKPEKRVLEFWVNIYDTGSPEIAFRNDTSHALAKADSRRRIACLHIRREYTEGEGLS